MTTRFEGGIGPAPGRVERFLLLPVAGFVLVQGVALALVEGGRPDAAPWLNIALWLASMLALHVALTLKRPRRDPFLLPLFALLTGWSVLLQARLAPNFLPRQTLWIVLGTALMALVAILPPTLELLRRYRTTLLLGGLLLLAVTLLFGVNPAGAGVALWLPVPFVGDVYFQPSELLKLLFVVYLASYYAERGRLLSRVRDRPLAALTHLGPLLLVWGFSLGLLVWQRDLGAATLFFILFLALLYVATGARSYVAGGFGLLFIASLAGYFLFDVVARRIIAWWQPWAEFDDRAFQIVQSLYALAAGRLIGSGIGQGFPDFVPLIHSDMVLAAVGEEWGLIGALTIVLCFALLTQRGMRLALALNDRFLRFLAAGITVLFATQALLILGGVTKLVPLTGVTLPFVSYGGSSLLLSSVMLGLLLWLSAAGHTILTHE